MSEKKEEIGSHKHSAPLVRFFFFLFSLWLVCSSRAHFSHDVGHTMAPTCICIHTAERSPTKEEESQPARTKRFSFFFSFLLEGVYIYLYIYIHINITEEPPALASWCPGPPFLPRALIPPTLMISSNNWRWQRKTGLPMQKWGWSVVFLCFILYTLFHHSGLLFFFLMLQFFVWLEDAKSSALVDPSRNVDNNRSRALTTTQKPLVAWNISFFPVIFSSLFPS